MSLTAATSDVKLFRDSVDTISQIIDEGIFKFGPGGIEFVAADRAMVAVIDFKLSKNAFEEYSVEGVESVGLNLGNLLTVLKRAGPSDKVMFKLAEGNKFEVNIVGDSTRHFVIPVLDIAAGEVPNTTQFEFPASVELSADVLAKGIDDANTIADSVIFEIGDGFVMSAETDMSKAELRLDKGSEALKNLVSMQPSKSRYPLEYLRKLIKGSKISGQTSIKIGNDYPMKMEFRSENATLSVILAPRVSEE